MVLPRWLAAWNAKGAGEADRMLVALYESAYKPGGPHTAAVRGVAFSPNGTRLAVASVPPKGTNGEVVVWDVASGQKVLAFRDHSGGVYGVSFSPDGRYLASAGEDHVVRIWDSATGKQLLTLPGHDD